MNHIYFLWAALQSAYQAFDRKSDQQEQRAVESYLCGSQSVAELESRERQWMRARA